MIKEVLFEEYKYLLKNLYNLSIEEIVNKKSFSGTVSNYDEQRILFSIYNLYMNNQYNVAYEKLNYLIKSKIKSTFVSLLSKDDLNNDVFNEIDTNYEFFKKHIHNFNTLMIREYDILNKLILNNNFLSTNEKEKNDIYKINFSFVNEIREIINSNLLKKNLIRGNKKLNINSNYVFKDTIIITNNFQKWIKNISNEESENIIIRIFYVIDDTTEAFNSFKITFQYKDTIYVLNDETTFENPNSKTARGNRNGGARSRRDVFEKVFFPFDEMNQFIIDERKEKEIVLDSNKNDIYYFYTIEKLSAYYKNILYLYSLISIDYFINNNVVNTYFIEDIQQSQKLLIPSQIDIDDKQIIDDKQYFSDFNYEKLIDCYNDLIIPDKNEIIKVDKNEIIKSLSNNNNLMNINDINKVLVWQKYEDKKNQLQKYFDKFIIKDSYYYGYEQSKLAKEDVKTLRTMFFDKHQNIISKMMYMGCDIQEFVYDGKSVLYTMNTDFCFSRFIIFKNNTKNVEYDEKFECLNCKNSTMSPDNTFKSMSIRFDNYKDICYFLEIERNELPEYFRNYISSRSKPSYGNNLLTNVNPLFMIRDYSSDRYANGIKVNFCICKRCWNKLVKNRAEYKKMYDFKYDIKSSKRIIIENE